MASQNLELKPCPHCGGKGDYYSYHPNDTRFELGVVAQCVECGYERVATVFGNDHDDEVFDALLKHVVDEWNEAWEKANNGELKMIDKIKTMVERPMTTTIDANAQQSREKYNAYHREYYQKNKARLIAQRKNAKAKSKERKKMIKEIKSFVEERIIKINQSIKDERGAQISNLHDGNDSSVVSGMLQIYRRNGMIMALQDVKDHIEKLEAEWDRRENKA